MKLSLNYHLNLHSNQTGVVHLLILLFLIIAIAAGIYLSLNPQVFRSKASVDNAWMQNLKITDSKGQTLKCDTTKDPVICYTGTEDINVSWQGASPTKK